MSPVADATIPPSADNPGSEYQDNQTSSSYHSIASPLFTESREQMFYTKNDLHVNYVSSIIQSVKYLS